MLALGKITGFEWDKGNTDKSLKKHGVDTKEAESVFSDEQLLLLEDIQHSEKEERLTAIGKSEDKRVLFASFTLRNDKIRVISVRPASKKERNRYEQTT